MAASGRPGVGFGGAEGDGAWWPLETVEGATATDDHETGPALAAVGRPPRGRLRTAMDG